jgi:nickel-dependent lactate racemase
MNCRPFLENESLVPECSEKDEIPQQISDGLRYDDIIRAKPNYSGPLTDAEILQHFGDLSPLPRDCLIIVNDNDRSTPSARIVRLLRERGLLAEPATFIIATGTHKVPPPEVAWEISGASDQDTLLIHDSMDDATMVEVGQTSRGTIVKVNQVLIDAEAVFTINGVEPHYFAGFTGGVKSLLPGLAAKSTVEQNHAWAITKDARLMKTVGNPIQEDLWEAAELVRPTDAVNTVQIVNHGDDILNVACGPLRPAFDDAKAIAYSVYGVPVHEKVNRIISLVLPPLNRTLYQAQKAMESSKNVMEDGGTFVLVAPCDQGIGTAAFFETMQSYGSPEAITQSLSFENYKFGDHKAFYWAELAQRAELLYVGTLPEDVIGSAFMRKIEVGDLLALVEQWHAAGDHILIDEAGGYSAVYLSE